MPGASFTDPEAWLVYILSMHITADMKDHLETRTVLMVQILLTSLWACWLQLMN